MKNIIRKLCVYLFFLVVSNAVPLKLIPGERNVIKDKGVTHTISRFYVVPSAALRSGQGSTESGDSVTEESASLEDGGTSTVYNDTNEQGSSSVTKTRTTVTVTKSNFLNGSSELGHLSSLLVQPVGGIISTNTSASLNSSRAGGEADRQTLNLRIVDEKLDDGETDKSNRIASDDHELDVAVDKLSKESVDNNNSSTKQVVDDSTNKADSILLSSALIEESNLKGNKEILSNNDNFPVEDSLVTNDSANSRSIQQEDLEDETIVNSDATLDENKNTLRSSIDEEYTDPWTIVNKLGSDIAWTTEDRTSNDIPWAIEDESDYGRPWTVVNRAKNDHSWTMEDKKDNGIPWTVDERVKDDIPWTIEDKPNNDWNSPEQDYREERNKNKLLWSIEDRIKQDILASLQNKYNAPLTTQKRINNNVPWTIEDKIKKDILLTLGGKESQISPWTIQTKTSSILPKINKDIPWYIEDQSSNYDAPWHIEDKNNQDWHTEDKINPDLHIEDKINDEIPWQIEDKLGGNANYIVKKKIYKTMPWSSGDKVVGTGPWHISELQTSPTKSYTIKKTSKQPYHVYTYVVHPPDEPLSSVSYEQPDLDKILNIKSTHYSTKLTPSTKNLYKQTTIHYPTGSLHVNKPNDYELQQNSDVTTHDQNLNSNSGYIEPETLHKYTTYNIKTDADTYKTSQTKNHNVYSDVISQIPKDYDLNFEHGTVDPKITQEYSYSLESNVVTPKTPIDYSFNTNSGTLDQPKISHEYSYSLESNVVTPKTPVDYSINTNSGTLDQPKISHDYSYSLESNVVTPKTPVDYSINTNSGTLDQPKISHDYSYSLESNVVTPKTPVDYSINTNSGTLDQPKISHEYSYSLQSNVVTPKTPVDYSINTNSGTLDQPKISHAYSYSLENNILTPKTPQDESQNIDYVILQNPQDYSLNVNSGSNNPKISNEYTYKVNSQAVTHKDPQDDSVILNIPQDYQLNVNPGAANQNIDTHTYSYSTYNDVVAPVTSQDHNYNINSGTVVQDTLKDYTLNVDTGIVQPKLVDDYSEIVIPYQPAPQTSQYYNLNINSDMIPKHPAHYKYEETVDIKKNVHQHPLYVPTKDSKNDRSLDTEPVPGPQILPTDLSSSPKVNFLPDKQLQQINSKYHNLNLGVANQHPNMDQNYLYTYNQKLVKPESFDYYQTSNLKLAPTYKLFTLQNLIKLTNGLKKRLKHNGLNSQEHDALNILLKVLQILLIQADYFGQQNDWYEKIFHNVPPQNRHPLQLYSYHLIRQRWLHDLLLLLHKNDFDLNIFHNPGIISILVSWRFPQYVQDYIEAEYILGKDYLLNHNTVNVGNPSYNQVEKNVCQHCAVDLENFVAKHVLNDYSPQDGGLIFNIAGLDFEPDANAVKGILQKYLLNKHAIEDQETVIMQDNKTEMLKQIILYLKHKGYRTQIITDLIHKLYGAVFPTVNKECAQQQNFPQTLYDVILPTLRRSLKH